MKAREYAELYKQEKDEIGRDNALKIILIMFLDEVKEIQKQRKSTTDSVVIAIVKEQSMKWRAFALLSGDHDIREDGFKHFVAKVILKEP